MGKGGHVGLMGYAHLQILCWFQVINQFPQSILPKLSSKTLMQKPSLQRMSEPVTPTFSELTFLIHILLIALISSRSLVILMSFLHIA